MNELLKCLYDRFYEEHPSEELLADIKRSHDALIEKLDKPERKLVLEIIDCKDHIAEDMSIDSFICGFSLAWKLGNELNMYERPPWDRSIDSKAVAVYGDKQKAE